MHIVDTVNDKIGSYIGLTVVVMTLMMTYEVLSRRLFNNPTSWAWPLCVQMQVVVAALAGGYCLLSKAHVRMDVIYSRFSPRTRAVIDIATFIFVLLFLGVALWKATVMGLLSFSGSERSISGFRPYIWHLKLIVIPLGILLFLVQEIAEFIRNLQLVLSERR